MAKKVVAKMSEEQFSKPLRDSAEQEFNSILRSELKPVLDELIDKYIERIKREFYYRFLNQSMFEFENELLSTLLDSLSQRIMSDLKKEGIVEFVNEDRIDLLPMLPPSEDKIPIAKQPLKWLIKGTKKLLINDPYFFGVPKGLTLDFYVNEIMDTLPISSLKTLVIISRKPKPSDTDTINQLADRLPKGTEFELIKNDTIHDRVWLLDDKKAYWVGTSFNGLGNKLSFINRLPTRDVKDFKEFLENTIKPTDKSKIQIG